MNGCNLVICEKQGFIEDSRHLVNRLRYFCSLKFEGDAESYEVSIRESEGIYTDMVALLVNITI
jgi:hypothetical protein